MNIDVIYPVHNRFYYTAMTFPRVLHECIETESKLFIYDDNSNDGSSEFIQNLIERSKYKVNYFRHSIGNSTYCINKTLDLGNAQFLYKVDNDILIPHGAFVHMIKHIPKDVGFMMMKETRGFPYIKKPAKIEKKTHIGGVGLFRREAFSNARIKVDGRFFGFTNFQNQSSWGKAMINSGNTNLDMCPWYSRSKEYQQKGYGRILNNVKSIWTDS